MDTDNILFHALNEQTPEMGYATLKDTLARADEPVRDQLLDDLACVAPFFTETGYAPLDQWMTQLSERQDNIPERDALYAQWQDNIEGLCVMHPAQRKGAVFTPDASEPGRVRYTEFDKHGFFAHSTFDTYAEAFTDAWQAGYRVPEPGSIDQMAITPEWAAGMKATLAIQQHNQQRPKSEDAESPSPIRPSR